MSAPDKIHPSMRIPPPLLFVFTFLAGVGLQRLAPLDVPSATLLPGRSATGIGLVACAVVLALSSLGIFIAARTTIIPFGAASTLVTWGPYRLTRNPMYVSLVAAYLGVAMILCQLWPLLLLPLPVLFVQRIVIPFEEKRMGEMFGESYDQYRSRVRRWL